jgi:hypothetical protein
MHIQLKLQFQVSTELKQVSKWGNTAKSIANASFQYFNCQNISTYQLSSNQLEQTNKATLASKPKDTGEQWRDLWNLLETDEHPVGLRLHLKNEKKKQHRHKSVRPQNYQPYPQNHGK